MTFVNQLSIIETVLTPIVTDRETLFSYTLEYEVEFAVALFVMMGSSGIIGFFIFKKLYEDQKINKLSDRAFIFSALVLG
jgi:hypothetical protein